MSDPYSWASDVPLTATTAARVVAAQFPQLQVTSLTPVGDGWDFWVFDHRDEIIFRFPKRKVAVEALGDELKYLPQMAPLLPLPVPQVKWRGKAEGYPFPFVGYPKLKGEMGWGIAPTDAHAKSLGKFLTALHGISSTIALGWGLPGVHRFRTDLVKMKEVGLARLEKAGPVPGVREIVEEATPCPETLLCPVHNDTGPNNLVFLKGEVAGVIDWSDASIGDPASDVGCLYYWGGLAFAERVLGHYGGSVDDGFLTRARFVAVYTGLAHLGRAVELNQPTEFFRRHLDFVLGK